MSPLVVIFVTVFIDLLGFGIIIPLLPFYAESFGASAFDDWPARHQLFADAVPVLADLGTLVGSHRPEADHPRRPAGLVPVVPGAGAGDSLALLFVARIVGGIAGANIPTAQAYIADVTTPENRAKGMGMVGAAFGLGFIFGPAIGGVLSRIGPETPMWFASALCFANFVAAGSCCPSRARSAPRPRRSAAWKRSVMRWRKPTLVLLLALYLRRHAGVLGLRGDVRDLQRGAFGFTDVDDWIRVCVHRRGARARAGRAGRQGRQGRRRAAG